MTDDDLGASEGVPRWVKVFAAVAVLVAVVAVVAALTGGGTHGPRRHGLGGAPAASR